MNKLGKLFVLRGRIHTSHSGTPNDLDCKRISKLLMSTRSKVNWPIRSCDLTRFLFFFHGHILNIMSTLTSPIQLL